MIARALLRQALERVVERFDADARPFAIIARRLRRHHHFVGVRHIGIVDLQDQAGIDDGLVFVAQRLGDRKDLILIAFIIFVLAIGRDARGRDGGHEEILDLRA